MTSACRRGFTLVELLVVSGLMAGLLGLVLSVGRPSGRSQVGQLLQLTSSAVLAAQTRALSGDVGAALILEPGAGGLSSFACNAIFAGDVPPFIVGSGTVGMPIAALGSPTYALSFASIANAATADLENGYQIRFSGTGIAVSQSPWFRFTSSGTAASGVVSLRDSAGQTIANTPWPPCLVGATGTAWRFEIACYPRKGAPLVAPLKSAAIDLRFSGVGDTGLGAYASLDNKGSIAICFDRDGRLDSVMQFGGAAIASQPLTPTAPLYLLIATLSDIQENRSLQSETSRWLAIAPATGRVTIAANIPAVAGTPGALAAARANARQGISQGLGR